ncbi:MAG: hypothetical protein JJU11_01245, partial [Candidatus Sumerlaeia bacterium]|nr:hypothetical protein [Candidatus Sumerlaeia bacterium]
RVTFAKFPLRLPGCFSGRVVLPEGMDVEDVSLSLCCEEIGDLISEEQFLDDDPLVALPIRSVRVKPSRFRFARRLSPEECHQFGPRPDEDKWWLELRPVGVTYRGEPFGPSEIALSYPLDVYNTQTRDTVGDPDEGENQAPPKLMGVGEDVSPFKWLLKEFKASTLLGLIPGTIMGGLSAIRWLMHDDAFLASIPESFLRGFLFLFAPRFLVGILARTRRSIRHHLLVSFACTYGMALTYALIKYLVLAPLGTTEVSPLPSKSLVILATISGFILGVYADELPDIYRNFGKEFREARKLEEDV